MKAAALLFLTSLVGAQTTAPKGSVQPMPKDSALPSAASLVMFGVTDLARSVAFYRDTLALPLRNASDEFAFFAAGPITLALSVPLGRAVEPRAGAMELVFSVQSVTASFYALTARGCRFQQTPREVTTGSWAATFADPDGHRLTLFGPR